jgi:hypothetical protein
LVLEVRLVSAVLPPQVQMALRDQILYSQPLPLLEAVLAAEGRTLQKMVAQVVLAVVQEEFLVVIRALVAQVLRGKGITVAIATEAHQTTAQVVAVGQQV